MTTTSLMRDRSLLAARFSDLSRMRGRDLHHVFHINHNIPPATVPV